jgi:hypothetical protein
MSTGLGPIYTLLKRAAQRLERKRLRLKSRCISPLAPSDMHMPIAIRLADIEKQRRQPR